MASSSQAARSRDELLVYLRRLPPALQRLTFPELFFNPVGQSKRELSSVEWLALEELPHLRETYLNDSRSPSPRRCFALLREEELLFFTVDSEHLFLLGSRSAKSMGSTPFFVSCDRSSLQRLFPTPLWEAMVALNPSEELLIAESSPKKALDLWVREEPFLTSLLDLFPESAASSTTHSTSREGLLPQVEGVGGTALHTAATIGDLSSLRHLISIRDLNARNERGETPLHCALRAGKSEAVDLLASAGARIDLADGRGVTQIELGCAISEEMGRVLIWPSNLISGAASSSSSAAPLLVDPLVIEQVNQKIEQIKAKLEQTQKEIKQTQGELEKVAAEREKLSQLIRELDERAASLATDGNQVNSNINEIQAEHGNALKESKRFQGKLQTFKKEVQKLQKRDQELVIVLESKQKKLRDLSDVVLRKEFKISRFKEETIFFTRYKSLQEEAVGYQKQRERLDKRDAEDWIRINQMVQGMRVQWESPYSSLSLDVSEGLPNTFGLKLKRHQMKRANKETETLAAKAQEVRKKQKWLSHEFVSFTRAKENEPKPRTTASSLLLSPSLLSPPQGFERLSEAELSRALIEFYSKGDGRSVLLALERLTLLASSQRRWVYAAHCLNAARMFAKKEAKNHLIYQMSISDRLERIEAQIAWDEWKVILPDSHRGSIDVRRAEISRIRKEVNRMLKRKIPGRHITAFLSQNISDLIASLIEETMEWLGMNPRALNFAVGAVGSMARLQMCPCSDIEIFFLLADPSEENIKRFQQLGRAVQMRITNWGETSGIHLKSPRRCDFEGKEITLPQAGLSIDSGLFSLHFPSDHLYGSPETLAKIQDLEYEDVVIANAMRLTRFVTGNRDLINRYQREVTRQLNAAAKTGTHQVRHLRAMALMKRDVEEFAPKLDISRLEERGFGIKAELYRLIQSVVAGLALYFNIDESDTFEQIERLKSVNVLSEEGAINLAEVLSFILKIRCMAHSFYGYECDILYRPFDQEESELFHITDQLASEIFRCYKTLLPLHEAACIFLRDGSTENFSSSALYDNSIRKSIESGFITSSDPNLDAELVQSGRRIGADPNDVEAHQEYARALRAAGRWQEAKKHYQIAVRLQKQSVALNHCDLIGLVIAQYQLGLMCADLGQFSEAKAVYEMGIDSCPEDSPYLSLLLADLGRLLAKLGDKEGAIISLEKAVALQKAVFIRLDFPRTLYSLGLLFIEIEKPEAAHARFEEALEWFAANEFYGNFHDLEIPALKASIQIVSGKIEEGIRTYEQVLARQIRLQGARSYPAVCEILLALVRTYSQIGDERRSHRYYRLLRSHLIYSYKSLHHPRAIIALETLSHIDIESEKVLEPQESVVEFFALFRSSPYRNHGRVLLSSSGASSSSSADPLLSEFNDEVRRGAILAPILILFEMAERAQEGGDYRQAALYLGCARFLIDVERGDDGPGLEIALNWYCDQLEKKFGLSLGATAEIRLNYHHVYNSQWLKIWKKPFDDQKKTAIELLAESTARQQSLLEQMISDAFLILGRPSTPFALLGVGAIACEEMWFNTGATLTILHSSELSDYFLRFKNLLEFWAILLGGVEHMDYPSEELRLPCLPVRGFSIRFIDPGTVDYLSCPTHLAGDRELSKRFIATKRWPPRMDLTIPKINRDSACLFDSWMEPTRRAVFILLLQNSLPFVGVGPGIKTLKERGIINDEIEQAINQIMMIRITKYPCPHLQSMVEAKDLDQGLDEVDQLLEKIYLFIAEKNRESEQL